MVLPAPSNWPLLAGEVDIGGESGHVGRLAPACHLIDPLHEVIGLGDGQRIAHGRRVGVEFVSSGELADPAVGGESLHTDLILGCRSEVGQGGGRSACGCRVSKLGACCLELELIGRCARDFAPGHFCGIGSGSHGSDGGSCQGVRSRGQSGEFVSGRVSTLGCAFAALGLYAHLIIGGGAEPGESSGCGRSGSGFCPLAARSLELQDVGGCLVHSVPGNLGGIDGRDYS